MKPRPASALALFSARLESYLSTHAFRLLFLSFYCAAVALMFAWGFKSEFSHEPNFSQPHFKTVRWFIGVARGMGYTLNLNTAFVILLPARLLFTKLRDSKLQLVLPFDAAFPKLHIIVGYTILFAVLFHASFHFVWLITWDAWQWGLWNFNMSVITGICLLIVFAVMLAFARPSVRKNNFRLFYAVHIIGALLFFALLILHGMFRTRPETYKWVLPPLIIYAIDRFIRKRKVSSIELQLSSENSVLKDGDIIELRLPKAFNFQAGQYAELQVPWINREWHPFTIASAPQDETMCFYIKALGDWTKDLREEIQLRIDGEVTDGLRVNVRGPYGAPVQHVGMYEKVVLVSGGVGSTPFSSICKDLHHRKVMQNAESPASTQRTNSAFLARIDNRVRTAISSLYGLSIDQEHANSNEVEEQKRVYLASMLNMTAGNSSTEPETEIESDEPSKVLSNVTPMDTEEDSERTMSQSTMDSYNTAGNDVSGPVKKPSANDNRRRRDEEEILGDIKVGANMRRGTRQRLAHLSEHRAKLLAFLHTTRVNFLLLLIMIARIFVICLSSILKADYIKTNAEPHVIESLWVAITDTSLSLIFAVVLPLTILLEVSYMGSRFFRTTSRTLDFFVFLPLTITSAALGIKAFVTEKTDEQIVMFLHYIIFVPTLFILLAMRMYRSVGRRTLLTDAPCRCSCQATVPDVDFIWTTPHETDDDWLRSELEPLATGTELKLHRYVTRTKEVDMEAGADFISTANAGRPDWDEIFGRIAGKSPSNSVVGVFFCGPHKMGESVQSAMRKAEINSNLRAAYLNNTKERTLMADLGLSHRGVIKMLLQRGCSVRFVFREENFS